MRNFFLVDMNRRPREIGFLGTDNKPVTLKDSFREGGRGPGKFDGPVRPHDRGGRFGHSPAPPYPGSAIVFTGRVVALLLLVFAAPVAADPVRVYSDATLIDGFAKTVFGVEASSPAARDGSQRVKKWENGVVPLTIVNVARRDRTREVVDFVALLNRSVGNLRIEIEPAETGAGTPTTRPRAVVFLVDRADYREVIRRTLPKGHDTGFLERQDCSAVVGGPDPYRLGQAMIYLVADEGDEKFHHCLVEEITQSLGPVNDDRSLTDSIYNDYNTVEGFQRFDWFILNMLYDERIRPGMTRAEARRVLPAVIATARRRLETLERDGFRFD